MNFKKTIFTGFAPNLTFRDTLQSVRFLLFPWKWIHIKRGNGAAKVEQWLKEYFNVKNAFTFDSGRSALFYGLKALGLNEGDEVAVQAYTCVVVINAIKAAGCRPVYVDIDNNFNMDPADLVKKIGGRAKALIIQHTFGVPAQIDKLMTIARERGLKTIEDCAHSLGATFKNQKLGVFGDIAMFSFGSDKIVSCARGGAVITNNNEFAGRLKEYQSRLPHTPYIKIIQHLFHFPIFFNGKLLYSLGVGKALLYLAKKMNIINKIIYEPEKHGRQLIFYPALLPNCLANILLPQLKNLDTNNKHRLKTAEEFNKKIDNSLIIKPALVPGAIYLRYTILINEPNVLRALGKSQNIIFGDWYNMVIAPKDIDMSVTGYEWGSCPRAEEATLKSINLPTDRHIKSKEIARIIKMVNGI